MAAIVQNAFLDTRVLGKPDKFHGKDGGWSDFRHETENYLAALDLQMPQYMTIAGRRPDKTQTAALGEQDQPKATQLYFVLNALLKGTAKKLLKKVKFIGLRLSWKCRKNTAL